MNGWARQLALRLRARGGTLSANGQTAGNSNLKLETGNSKLITVHPLPVRICHWVNVLAVLIMVLSGWRIYNASPLFDFKFPAAWTLGGWLAGALQWHFAAMWLLAVNGLVYVAYGIFSGHFRSKLLPVSPAAVLRDVGSALRGRLAHEDLRVYNAAQRAAYLGAIVLAVFLILTGLVIWKPVQFQTLGLLMGDYEGARYLHFFAMVALLVFVVLHVVMVALVPRTLPSMFTGRIRVEGAKGEGLRVK
jgi:thiosulfate reductase cytochrome b subunit